MKKSTRSKLAAALAELETADDVREANQLYNNAVTALQQRAKLAFSVGDKVQFKDRSNCLVRGQVVAINKKNIKVKQEDGRLTWNVAPSLLTPVK